MITDQYGQLVFNDLDVSNLILAGHFPLPDGIIVDDTVNISHVVEHLDMVPNFIKWVDDNKSVAEFDHTNQKNWFMPNEYKNLDIAEYILGLCTTQAELQRAGEELLLYQEKDLFDLLRFLKYLMDTLKNNNIIWGVGRGSSVSSHVLYLMGVHRIDSMFYDLDIREFLR